MLIRTIKSVPAILHFFYKSYFLFYVFHPKTYFLFYTFVLKVYFAFYIFYKIGGKTKGQKQIAGIENSWLVKDDIETGSGNVVPLWVFGFMY